MFNYDLSGKNKYYTLYSLVRDDILGGRLRAGTKLPGKRTLAQDLGVSVITVQTAYEQLLAEGYVTSKERSGYYVAEIEMRYTRKMFTPPLEREKETSYETDFVKGSAPAELFPFSSWAKLMRGVLSDCGEHLLERVPCDGDMELKEALADYLYRMRGIFVDPRCIVIGAGAEYLYGVVVQLLGRDKLYALENPCYRKIYRTYTLSGARCALIDVGGSGIDCAETEKAGPDVVHISPNHQFPTGAVMPASARTRIINYVTGRGGYIVEDDYDSEFRLYGKPLQNIYGLCPDRVIYINTFSKTLAPSMRIGYMILPSALYGEYLELFGSSSSAVPLFEQKTLARMISSGIFERHISRLKNYYRSVRDVLLKKLENMKCPHEVCDTGSGLHFTVKFPSASSDDEIKEKAKTVGINIRCLSDYLLSPRDGCEKTVVINYSGVTLKEAEKLPLLKF